MTGGAASLLLLIQVAGVPSTPAPAPPVPAVAPVTSDPAETTEIVEAVRSCVNGVTPGDFDPKIFKADGWLPGGRQQTTISGIPTQQLLYGKPGGHVVDIVQIMGPATSCVTVAAIKSTDQISEVRQEIMAAFKLEPFDTFKGDELFKATMTKQFGKTTDKFLLSEHRRFIVDLVGDKAKPIIKILMTPRR